MLDYKKLPSSPGVYLMKDDAGQVIYVGKAKSLKNRVSQYFQTTRHIRQKFARWFQTSRILNMF